MGGDGIKVFGLFVPVTLMGKRVYPKVLVYRVGCNKIGCLVRVSQQYVCCHPPRPLTTMSIYGCLFLNNLEQSNRKDLQPGEWSFKICHLGQVSSTNIAYSEALIVLTCNTQKLLLEHVFLLGDALEF